MERSKWRVQHLRCLGELSGGAVSADEYGG